MTEEELKLCQLSHQYLTAPGERLTVVRALCGLQAQFLSNALHALRIRCQSMDEADATDGLVKNWTLRGTMHVLAESDLPLFLHCGSGELYRKNEWPEKSFWNQRDDWALTPERQRELSSVIIEAAAQRPHTRNELKALCRARGMNAEEEASMFDAWGGGLRELCERGFLHYAVGEQKTLVATPTFIPMPKETAQLEIARRYFTHYGPATLHDAAYFLHARQEEIREWLRQLPAVTVTCAGKTYYMIPRTRPVVEEMPDCLFLAGFDPLLLGYEKKESLYLPQEHLRGIFTLTGIVMPSILRRGRVVGRWKRQGKRVLCTLFEPLEGRARGMVEEKALSLWPQSTAVCFQ